MHTAPRLHIRAPLHEGAEITASPAQAHHLGSVLRHAPGDAVRVFNAASGEFAGVIETLRKGTLLLRLRALLRAPLPDSPAHLVFAVLKRDATDLVVQKATELGVTDLHPVFTERTNAGRVNQDRLESIAEEAAVQCERLSVPVVHPARPLADLLGVWPAAMTLAAALERRAAPPLAPPLRALLIGPEGGFTPRELDVLAAKPFITPVSLGPLVLRADTAAIAGLALLLAHPAPAGPTD